MFTDLNRYAHKTSKSLDVLYDHRDNVSGSNHGCLRRGRSLPRHGGKEKITIPIRSHKLFTLATLYDANQELIGEADKRGTKDFEQKLALATGYWSALANVITDWKKVKRKTESTELRQEKINTHAGRNAGSWAVQAGR